MRPDVNYSHSKNIGEQIGNFCDVPILTYDNFELELDIRSDTQRTVLQNKVMGCSDIPNTAEILPGEVLCADNIVRRVTAAEAVGYDTFKEKNPVKMLVGLHDGRKYSAEDNKWVETGHTSQQGQATPEEMCAWLNAQPKSSFKTEVLVDGEDKLLRTTDKAGNLLYGFRYIEGLPGTYIGGDEVRPLDPPQLAVGKNSPSRVIQYFDQGNNYKRKAVEPKEWQDEWEQTKRYVPTSHVERATIGGTALFEAVDEGD